MIFIISAVITIVVLRGIYLYVNPIQKLKDDTMCKTCIVLGSGGHTNEMIRLLHAMSSKYEPRTYIITSSDMHSKSKAKAYELEYHKNDDVDFIILPRAREVGQSYLTSISSTITSFNASLNALFVSNPNILLMNGPGTCLPLCTAAIILRILNLSHTRLVYIESFARVKSLSMTGKIAYHLVDEFIVQWPELLQRYPKSNYLGNVM